MDFDDLFSAEENVIPQQQQQINEEYNQMEEDNFFMKKKKVQKPSNNIEYNNKMGWILRRPLLKNKLNEKGVKVKNELEYIEFHKTSYVPGSYIKNAITGEYYKYLVGSNNEKLLFKILICTGEKGTLNYVNGEWIAEPCILFYDSPEECERHLCSEIKMETKRLWLEKRNKYLFEQTQKQTQKSQKYL
jgi:hypothetical protein